MSTEIRVKVLSPVPVRYFRHQLPDADPVWGDCRFIFDPDERDYDWLLVYEDLPRRPDVPAGQRCENLPCPASHTLLTTSEPSSIKHYGNPYTRQFGCVITSQEAWALPHRDRLFSQAGLIWMYGVGSDGVRTFDDMVAHPPLAKSKDLSMVFSPKRQRHTLHHRRHAFMCKMMQWLPSMDVFGRGVRPLENDDKAAALDAYRYHIAVENHNGRHHWTEKLSDAFLGLTLPFYSGCPNADDYFPEESFIRIDINRPEEARRIIETAIADNEFERRLPAIIEARRRVLYEYNLFALAAREIGKRHGGGSAEKGGGRICSRHALRKNSTTIAIQDVLGKIRARLLHMTRYR